MEAPQDAGRSGLDWGLLTVLMLLALIPLAIWRLLADAGSATPARAEAAVPAEEAAPADAPPRRRARPAEIARLEQRLEAARRELERARLERSQSPAGLWDDAIADQQREIRGLEEQLARLRGR